MSLFGPAWDELELRHVESFLAGETDEGLTWEAKGDDVRGGWGTHSVRKAVCAFANSELGGYIIVGAVQVAKGGHWSLPGLAKPPSTDLTAWLSSTIRSGVQPWTNPLIRRWDGPRGPVALIRIEPVAVPPAITVDGLVYERAVGESVKVRSPDALARLFGRGEKAWQVAQQSASAAAWLQYAGASSHAAWVAVSVAPTCWPPDIGVRLLRRSTAEGLAGRLSTVSGGRVQSRFVGANGVLLTTLASDEGAFAFLPTSRHAVQVAFWDSSGEGRGLVLGGRIERVAAVAADTIEALDGYGPSYLKAWMNFARGVGQHGIAEAEIRLAGPRPAALELEWVTRELLRGADTEFWEPEPTIRLRGPLG